MCDAHPRNALRPVCSAMSFRFNLIIPSSYRNCIAIHSGGKVDLIYSWYGTAYVCTLVHPKKLMGPTAPALDILLPLGSNKGSNKALLLLVKSN